MTTAIALLSSIEPITTAWTARLARKVNAGELKPATAAQYERHFGHFVNWLHSTGTQRVNLDALLEYKAAMLVQGDSTATVNLKLTAVRRFYEFANAEGLILENPAAALEGAKRRGTKERHRRDALTPAEVRAVLAWPDRNTLDGARNYLILCLMAYAGLRSIEVHRATFADLKTDSGRLTMNVHGKGDKDRLSVFPVALEDALLSWRAMWRKSTGPLVPSLSNRAYGEPLSLSAIRTIVKLAYDKAGVDLDTGNKTTHSLRHSAASALAAGGVPIQAAAEILGHSDPRTTMIYYHNRARLTAPGEDAIDYGR